MPVYSWRRRPTKHFGDVWVPYAEVEIQQTDGHFQALALQVDSGAVVSLLRRSVADVLGVDLESGRRIELGSVGGGRTNAYVHEIPSRFGDGVEKTVAYAIAEIENVPNLLGRHVVFDELQVDFDASLEETRISAPWLDRQQRRIFRFLLATQNHILARWSENPLPGRADEAANILMRRGRQLFTALVGLLKLHRAYACPPLLRSLLETQLQLEFLLEDPNSRAEAYLDFEHITRYKQFRALVKAPPGTIGYDVANAPQRKSGEPALKREYDRVRHAFIRGNKSNRTWDNWYCMTTADMAKHLGRLPEYRLWYKACSAWAHGDPSASRREYLFRDNVALTQSICWCARMQLHIADAKKIVLTGEQFEFLKKCEAGVN